MWKEEPLSLADSEPEPDISVTRGGEGDFSSAHPTTAELVVAVAVSSPALDRENASLYAEAGVKEYWIMLGTERELRCIAARKMVVTRRRAFSKPRTSSNVPASRRCTWRLPNCSRKRGTRIELVDPISATATAANGVLTSQPLRGGTTRALNSRECVQLWFSTRVPIPDWRHYDTTLLHVQNQ